MNKPAGRLLILGLISLFAASSLFALEHLDGYVSQGGGKAVANMTGASIGVQRSYPHALVTVYDAGTLNLATIYASDGTALANPMSASSTGYWSFYTAGGCFDLAFSGGGIGTPYTIANRCTPNAGHIINMDPYARVWGANDTAIAHAITDATSGDTLLFTANYQYVLDATINVTKPLTFSGPGGGHATLLCRLPIGTEKLFYVTSSNVTFYNLRFDGTGASSDPLTVRKVAIFFDGDPGWITDLRVDRCSFTNLTRKGIGQTGNLFVATATNTNPIQVTTTTAHALTTGDVITVTGLGGVLAGADALSYTGAVTVIDGTHFELTGKPAAGNYTSGGQILAVVSVTGNGVGPIVVQTAGNHGLTTGDHVTVASVGGNTAANGAMRQITVVDANHFSIDGTTGNGAYTSGGTVGEYFGQGAHSTAAGLYGTAGNAALSSEYGVLVSRGDGVRITNNTTSEISGSAFFVTRSRNVWIEDNDIAMLTSGDNLYALHVDESIGTDCYNIWIARNHIRRSNNASGGAIDIMSQNDTAGATGIRRVWITDNLIEDSTGYGSGTALLRVYSVEEAHILGNTIRAISEPNSIFINLDARIAPSVGSGLPDNPGPVANEVRGNLLVASAALQTGIRVRHSMLAGGGGLIPNTGMYLVVSQNQLITDNTYWFTRGIRVEDTPYALISGNLILQKFSNTFFTAAHQALEFIAINKDVTGGRVESNTIDCYDVASGRGISVSGTGGNTVDDLVIANNTLLNGAADPIILAATVNSPTVINNTYSSCVAGAKINNSATAAFMSGNRFTSDVLTGTWTITNGTASVTVSTAEVRTGDRINLTVTTDTANDVAVKASTITNGTSFVVKTINTAVTGADVSGTWRIDH